MNEGNIPKKTTRKFGNGEYPFFCTDEYLEQDTK